MDLLSVYTTGIDGVGVGNPPQSDVVHRASAESELIVFRSTLDPLCVSVTSKVHREPDAEIIFSPYLSV